MRTVYSSVEHQCLGKGSHTNLKKFQNKKENGISREPGIKAYLN